MASTVGDRYVTGTVTATNAAMEIRKVGFRPRKVAILNQTNQVRLEWNEQLPEGYGIKIVAAGDLTILTTGAISLLDGSSTEPPGFQIDSALADINDTTTEILSYEAWG